MSRKSGYCDPAGLAGKTAGFPTSFHIHGGKLEKLCMKMQFRTVVTRAFSIVNFHEI